MVLPQYIQKDLEIIQDTRERKPLKFPGFNVVQEAIPCGKYSFDYAFRFKRISNKLVWERKECGDAISTFTLGRESFEKKLSLARDMGFSVVLVLEYDMRSAFNKRLYSKASRKVLINSPLSWAIQGLCIPVFCSNRTMARNSITSMIESWIHHRKF